MLSYGGSITSAFPNTFCSTPATLTCQLCNSNINEAGLNTAFYQNNSNQNYLNPNKLEKCTHCGINICQKCLNQNQEIYHNFKIEDSSNKNLISYNSQQQIHYNTVKKEFKHMYNYSKDIVEKLHLLNNSIKIEESAVSELNLIKHQVNTKALELIKQINQEKAELIEQIESVKIKYESTLNDRKEYYALSVQFKDELRKVIRKYKEFKSEEQCSLSDLLNLYFTVKHISKNLDDYNHIKLITEQVPLQVKFEERPIYRNLIGKLVINQKLDELLSTELRKSKSSDNLDGNIQKDLNKISSRNGLLNEPKQKIDYFLNRNKNTKVTTPLSNNNHNDKSKIKNQIESNNNDVSRSYSLNDLIDAANEFIDIEDKKFNHDKKCNTNFNNVLNKTKKINKSTPILNKNDHSSSDECEAKEYYLKSNKNLDKIKKNSEQKISNQSNNILGVPPLPPPSNYHLTQPPLIDYPKNQYPNYNLRVPLSQLILAEKYYTHVKQQKSLLSGSKSSMDSETPKNLNSNNKNNKSNKNNHLNSNFVDNIQNPKQRLEIDILPSYLNCSNNQLLIASSFGKIRVIDLFTYKMQKDELKSLLINGICMPKRTITDSDNEILYALTNGEMNSTDDVLNVSNSTIIVTKRELKVLKIENNAINNINDDYVFLNPSGICYDSYDHLYICDSGYNRIKVFDKQLSLIKIIDSASNSQDRLCQPKSVCSYENILFVCDSANHRIVSYSILNDGNDFKFRNIYGYGFGDELGMLKYPLECCVDSKGILYVRDHHNNRVQLFGSDATPLNYIQVNSQKETIYSMAVNDNGDVYVAKMVNIPEEGQLTAINKYYIDIY